MIYRILSTRWLALIALIGLISATVTPLLNTTQFALAQPNPIVNQRSVNIATAALPEEAPLATYEIFMPMISASPVLPTVTPTPTATPTATPGVPPADQNGWSMAGANPQRTSWVSEEVSGNLSPAWYIPFDAFIPYNVQIIVSNNSLYVSTSKGLYSLSASTGAVQWVFPTELPLGNSPTIVNGIAYVGGFDHKLYAIDTSVNPSTLPTDQKTGYRIISPLWSYEASKGFDTNPLVVNGMVYVGDRDGYMYAIYANENSNKGQLVWKFKTDGPIHFSAATSSDNSTIYFASDDSYGYALNSTNGQLVWKTAKFPGDGFHSWWPVVYRDAVIFSGSSNYRSGSDVPDNGYLANLDRDYLYPDNASRTAAAIIWPTGNVPGDWVAGTSTIDASAAMNYLESDPWRRTYFLVNSTTGQEITYDLNHNGKPEYAPFPWTGTHSGNRYPPIVSGFDNVIYQYVPYYDSPYISQGNIVGWKIGTPYISRVASGWQAVDEPEAFSGGGSLIYYNLVCNRSAGVIDTSSTSGYTTKYFDYNLSTLLPGYAGFDESSNFPNDVYKCHGNQNPLVPYHGKVYFHKGNALIAWDTTGGSVRLANAQVATAPSASITNLSDADLKTALGNEVSAIVNAGGFLRPGYQSAGLFDQRGRQDSGDHLTDYFRNPSDTIYTLLMAMPYLSSDLQSQTKTYLQNFFSTFPPYTYSDIGWNVGGARETFDTPPEVATSAASISSSGPLDSSSGWVGWGKWTGTGTGFPPHMFYALWKYAQTFGGASAIFDASKSLLSSEPATTVYQQFPYVANSFIAGYEGYCGLEKLANNSTTCSKQSALNALLAWRAANFSTTIVNADDNADWYSNLAVASNFMYMTPELAQYLHDNALTKVSSAINTYTNTTAPYWFVSKYEATAGEGVIGPLYDYSSLMLAKAWILKQPREELLKYLDVPSFARGDLFYIQNLILAIEAQP